MGCHRQARDKEKATGNGHRGIEGEGQPCRWHMDIHDTHRLSLEVILWRQDERIDEAKGQCQR